MCVKGGFYAYRSFRYKVISLQGFSIQVYSVELKIVSRPWLKERRKFTQNVFLVLAQTILEENVQFYCVSSCRNNLYGNDWLPILLLWNFVKPNCCVIKPGNGNVTIKVLCRMHSLFSCDHVAESRQLNQTYEPHLERHPLFLRC